jgi:hypothetical protein
MKKSLICILFLFSVVTAFAQDNTKSDNNTSNDEQIKTLFRKGSMDKITLGYFFEINAGYTKFGSEHVFLPGLNMGLILNHNWSVGLAGSLVGNPGNIYYDNIYYPVGTYSAMQGANLIGGYGGGLLEYTAFPKSVVHFSVPVIIGGGYFAYVDDFNYDYHNSDTWGYNTIDWTACFVVEPGLKLEVNILKMLRMGVGVSYRYSPNLDLINTSDNLINQVTGRFSLRFGKF